MRFHRINSIARVLVEPSRALILSRAIPYSTSTSYKLSTKTVGTIRRLKKEEKGTTLALTAGVPFVLFSVLATWVVSNAVDGKLKEMEAWQGKTSKSVRQAKLETEHDEMMERLNKIVSQDFDNTKRIKRPQEILEERRLEREQRNRWYRRLYRWAFKVSDEGGTNGRKA